MFHSTTFNQKVWNLCRKISKGRVSTYKELARALNTKAYRAVGNALNKNPYWPEVPCHRVINSDGRVGGFAHGQKKKILLLENEGIKVKRNRIALANYLFRF
jgi:methylated-DNA-[protein]-cysteine S-methyltransferase